MNHITGTAHSSSSKLRFVLLLSLLLCAFAQQPVRSQDGAAPLRDGARLCGFFPFHKMMTNTPSSYRDRFC